MTAQSVVLKNVVFDSKVSQIIKAEIGVVTKFGFTCPLTQDGATALGVGELLYRQDGLSTGGFQNVSLCPIEESLKVLVDASDLGMSMNLNVDRCELSVDAPGDGLEISAKLTMTGDPHTVVEFIAKAGEWACEVTISKAQQQMDFSAPSTEDNLPIEEPLPTGEPPEEPKASRKRKKEATTEPPAPQSDDTVLVHFQRVPA